jgi:hypothetical protein
MIRFYANVDLVVKEYGVNIIEGDNDDGRAQILTHLPFDARDHTCWPCAVPDAHLYPHYERDQKHRKLYCRRMDLL